MEGAFFKRFAVFQEEEHMKNEIQPQAAEVEEVCEQAPQLQILEYQPGVEIHVEWSDDLKGASRSGEERQCEVGSRNYGKL